MCAHPGSRPAERWTVEKGPSWDGGGHLWSKTDEQGQTSDICIIIPKTPGPLTRQPRPLLRAHPQAGGRGTPEGGQHSGRCCCWREGAPLRTHTGSRGAQVGGGAEGPPGTQGGGPLAGLVLHPFTRLLCHSEPEALASPCFFPVCPPRWLFPTVTSPLMSLPPPSTCHQGTTEKSKSQ